MILTEIALGKSVNDLYVNYSTGNLYLTDKKLTSLKGCPKTILGDFDCDQNHLESLLYGPTEVKGHYFCSNNKLITLKGAPIEIGMGQRGGFFCDHNELTSLEYCPERMNGSIYCNDNNIDNFHDIHKLVKQISGSFQFQKNPIKSHVLGLLLIKGIRVFTGGDILLSEILNNTLVKFPNEPKKRVLYAQKRLLEEHENGQELAKL